MRKHTRLAGQVSDWLAALLEGLLEPLVEERLSAAEALALLRGDTALTPARCAALEAHGLHYVVMCATRRALSSNLLLDMGRLQPCSLAVPPSLR